MKNRFRIFGAVGLLFVATGIRAAADFEFPPVTVTWTRPWSTEIVYDSAYQNYTVAMYRAFENAYRGQMGREEYQEFRDNVAAAFTDKQGSPDARCNILATAATKATTSRSDQTERYLAAHQLFSAVRGARGMLGITSLIGGSPPKVVNGKLASTFTMTYSDGGSETWPVAETVPPTIMDQPVGPPPSGDGVAKPCPYSMKG